MKKKTPLKPILITVVFFCLMAGSVYFLIWSPVLWIEKIDVRPLGSNIDIREIIQRNLDEKLWQFIPQKSFFLVPLEKIGKDILDKFPQIREVDISKKLPNSVVIEIKERQSIGLWCQKTDDKIENCFYIDQEGIIFKEAPIMSGSLVLNLYSASHDSVKIRDQVTSPKMIDFILKTAQGLSLKIDNFEIVSLEDLRVKTSEGWQIYFNPLYPVDSQVKALEMVLEKEIKETSSLEYIDLRIEGRVYYR